MVGMAKLYSDRANRQCVFRVPPGRRICLRAVVSVSCFFYQISIFLQLKKHFFADFYFRKIGIKNKKYG